MPCTVCNKPDHIVQLKSIQKYVPFFIIIRETLQIGKGGTAVLGVGRFFPVSLFFFLICLQGLLESVGRNAPAAACERDRLPVGTGEDRILVKRKSKEVLKFGAGHIICPIKDVFLHGIGFAVRGEERIVHIFPQREAVFSGFQEITSIGEAPGRQIPDRAGDRHGVRIARIDHSSFGKACQFDGRFFNAAGRVIRCVKIQLNNIFPGFFTGICHGYLCGDGFFFNRKGGQFLRKLRVGKAMPEREDNIFPVRFLLFPEAGFIIAVACINALTEMQGVLPAHVGIVTQRGSGVSRIGGEGCRPGIGCAAGRIDFAGKDPCKLRKAARAGSADPEDGINAVEFREEPELNRSAGRNCEDHVVILFADTFNECALYTAFFHHSTACGRRRFVVFREC